MTVRPTIGTPNWSAVPSQGSSTARLIPVVEPVGLPAWVNNAQWGRSTRVPADTLTALAVAHAGGGGAAYLEVGTVDALPGPPRQRAITLWRVDESLGFEGGVPTLQYHARITARSGSSVSTFEVDWRKFASVPVVCDSCTVELGAWGQNNGAPPSTGTEAAIFGFAIGQYAAPVAPPSWTGDRAALNVIFAGYGALPPQSTAMRRAYPMIEFSPPINYAHFGLRVVNDFGFSQVFALNDALAASGVPLPSDCRAEVILLNVGSAGALCGVWYDIAV